MLVKIISCKGVYCILNHDKSGFRLFDSCVKRSLSIHHDFFFFQILFVTHRGINVQYS